MRLWRAPPVPLQGDVALLTFLAFNYSRSFGLPATKLPFLLACRRPGSRSVRFAQQRSCHCLPAYRQRSSRALRPGIRRPPAVWAKAGAAAKSPAARSANFNVFIVEIPCHRRRQIAVDTVPFKRPLQMGCAVAHIVQGMPIFRVPASCPCLSAFWGIFRRNNSARCATAGPAKPNRNSVLASRGIAPAAFRLAVVA